MVLPEALSRAQGIVCKLPPSVLKSAFLAAKESASFSMFVSDLPGCISGLIFSVMTAPSDQEASDQMIELSQVCPVSCIKGLQFFSDLYICDEKSLW